MILKNQKIINKSSAAIARKIIISPNFSTRIVLTQKMFVTNRDALSPWQFNLCVAFFFQIDMLAEGR
jgi:hypothetical protein